MDLVKFCCYRKLLQRYQELKELLSSFVDNTDPAVSLTKNTEITKQLCNK